jgi:ubiquinone biosynthesis protein
VRANIAGSIRYPAPELSLVDVFCDELRGIMFHLARDLASEREVAGTAVEMMLGATSLTGRLSTILRDLADGTHLAQSPRSRVSPLGRTDQRSFILGVGAAALWLSRRRRP